VDFAQILKYTSDVLYPRAEKIDYRLSEELMEKVINTGA